MSESARRLTDLFVDLHETMDLEIKGWLDLAMADHQAKLAKAIIAMANHGGGYIVIGFTERAGLSAVPAGGRPASLKDLDRDRVNGVSERYLQPVVHCEVYHITAPDGADYPLIVVPGGHRSPVMARRDGPTGGELKNRAIYIRRAGPKSEEPRTAEEMTALFDRCFANRRDDIGDIIRTILSGSMPVPVAIEGAPPALNTWIYEGCNRHAALVETLPKDDPRRFPLGYFIFAYELRGTIRPVSIAELLGILSTRMPRHTGWPPWWVPTRQGIAPYPNDEAVECWLGGDEHMLGKSGSDAAHSDFWRVSPKGLAFLMRGYQEDGPEVQARGFEPGKAMDATVPVWRAGEALLHAEALASALGDGPIQVVFRANYTGLSGRSLVSVSGDRLFFDRTDLSRSYSMVLNTTVEASIIRDKLPEIEFELLKPLYELFNFFKLPISLVQEEITKMTKGRF